MRRLNVVLMLLPLLACATADGPNTDGGGDSDIRMRGGDTEDGLDVRIGHPEFSPERPLPGQPATVSYVITNGGDEDATNVTLTVRVLNRDRREVFRYRSNPLPRLTARGRTLASFLCPPQEEGEYFIVAGIEYNLGASHGPGGLLRPKLSSTCFRIGMLPDLVVETVETTLRPAGCGEFTLLCDTTVTIRNQGVTACTFPANAEILRVCTTHGPSWPTEGEHMWSRSQGLVIGPGGVISHTFPPFQYPGDDKSTRTVQHRAWVDIWETVAESDERNNTHDFGVEVSWGLWPDFVITSVELSTPQPTHSEPFSLIVIVKNDGGDFKATETWRVIEAWTSIWENEQTLWPAGTSRTYEFPANESAMRAGTSTWGVTLDPDDSVIETDEANNSASIEVTVVE